MDRYRITSLVYSTLFFLDPEYRTPSTDFSYKKVDFECYKIILKGRPEDQWTTLVREMMGFISGDKFKQRIGNHLSKKLHFGFLL